MRFTFYILHTHVTGQDLSMLDKMLTPVTLTFTLESAFRFSKSAFRFRKLITAPILIEVHLLYLAHTCLGIRPFHACRNFDPCDPDPCDPDLDLRVCV